jgi:hypothetical protein
MRGLSLVLVAAMVGGMAPGMIFGQAAATAPAAGNAMKAKAPVTMPTDAEIADAKAKGMVWANENTKVYQADAQAAGYHLAKASGGKKKAAAAAAPQQ